MTILDRIVATKRKALAAAQQRRPLDAIRRDIARAAPPRDFAAAVVGAVGGEVRLIAEIKKASPSAGVIVPDFDPVRIARIYADHGAAALSVLTDEPYFQGRLEFIGQVRQAVGLPVLRKDFLLCPYQVFESRAGGADAVLLIAEVLSEGELAQMAETTRSLGMAALVEVHTERHLASVSACLGSPGEGGYLLGINNRDLAAQRIDLSTMERLAAKLPSGTLFVAESGITAREDVLAAGRAGACAVLIGESLLAAADIGGQVDRLSGR